MANEDAYAGCLASNKRWAASFSQSHPDLFPALAVGQHPQILWIGCSDSRCPETTLLGLQPGDVFTHRNIANIVSPTDLSSLSVIQFAVQYLKVKHVIVCGHVSCGGVNAAMDNQKLGLIDTWLLPLRALRRENLKALEALEPKEAALKLVELNVRQGVKVLLENPVVIDAVAERGLKVHGVVYDVGTGLLRDLEIEEDEQTMKERKAAFQTV